MYQRQKSANVFERPQQMNVNVFLTESKPKKEDKGSNIKLSHKKSEHDKKSISELPNKEEKNLSQERSSFKIQQFDGYWIKTSEPKSSHRRMSGSGEIPPQNQALLKNIEALRRVNKVLQEQNHNLKEQNKYLVESFHKMKKKYNQQIDNLQNIIQQLQISNNEYRLKIQEQKLKLVRGININTPEIDIEEIDNPIILKKKLEVALEEYEKNKSSELKKICMDLARKIKLFEHNSQARYSEPEITLRHRRNQTAHQRKTLKRS